METQEIQGVTYGLFLATCKTEGCENKDKPLELWIPTSGAMAVCGPCGTLIASENIVEKPA
jgi:hypothetical protein